MGPISIRCGVIGGVLESNVVSWSMWFQRVKRSSSNQKEHSRFSSGCVPLYEIHLRILSNGKYLFTKRGTEKEIVFTKAEAKRMKQCIVSHNHPSGASFSIPDWKLFQELKLQEIRAIAEDKVYYLRRVNDFELKMSEEEFENELKRMRRSVRRKYQKMYEGGIINKKERLLLSSDEYNRKAAEKFGFEYGEECLDG